VQVQTATGCNADCVFCPYGATAAAAPRGRMSWELYETLLEECASHPVRRISPYLMNEPLLDPEIWDRVRLAKRIVPGARVTLTTNGSLLDETAVERIMALDGTLHELTVSVQGIEPRGYAEAMGGRLELGRCVENVLRLAGALRRARARRPALTVTMVATGSMEAGSAVSFWRERGVAARMTRLDNQGGLVAVGEGLCTGAMVPNEPCPRPHKQAYVTFDGEVVVCCADYRRSVVLGNIQRSSLSEIWNGPLAVSVRRAHIDRDRAAMPALCRECRIDSGGVVLRTEVWRHV